MCCVVVFLHFPNYLYVDNTCCIIWCSTTASIANRQYMFTPAQGVLWFYCMHKVISVPSWFSHNFVQSWITHTVISILRWSPSWHQTKNLDLLWSPKVYESSLLPVAVLNAIKLLLYLMKWILKFRHTWSVSHIYAIKFPKVWQGKLVINFLAPNFRTNAVCPLGWNHSPII